VYDSLVSIYVVSNPYVVKITAVSTQIGHFLSTFVLQEEVEETHNLKCIWFYLWILLFSSYTIFIYVYIYVHCRYIYNSFALAEKQARKDVKDSFFNLFLKLVQINFIFSDNVRIFC